MIDLGSYTLVLGSKSPRRQELLKELGFSFSVRTKETDESYPDEMNPEQIPAFLAEKKALALEKELTDTELLITSDTIVVSGNEVLGKPENESEAEKMLLKLSGAEHRVISGVCLCSSEKKRLFSVETKVFFRNLSEEEIKYYISNFRPMDKAGAYGIQEWIGMIGIERIEGSYYNVMGLPTAELWKELQTFK